MTTKTESEMNEEIKQLSGLVDAWKREYEQAYEEGKKDGIEIGKKFIWSNADERLKIEYNKGVTDTIEKDKNELEAIFKILKSGNILNATMRLETLLNNKGIETRLSQSLEKLKSEAKI
jgi:hypothetical protein